MVIAERFSRITPHLYALAAGACNLYIVYVHQSLSAWTPMFTRADCIAAALLVLFFTNKFFDAELRKDAERAPIAETR